METNPHKKQTFSVSISAAERTYFEKTYGSITKALMSLVPAGMQPAPADKPAAPIVPKTTKAPVAKAAAPVVKKAPVAKAATTEPAPTPKTGKAPVAKAAAPVAKKAPVAKAAAPVAKTAPAINPVTKKPVAKAAKEVPAKAPTTADLF